MTTNLCDYSETLNHSIKESCEPLSLSVLASIKNFPFNENSSKKGEQSYNVLNIEPSHILHQANTRINDYEKEHWHTGH